MTVFRHPAYPMQHEAMHQFMRQHELYEAYHYRGYVVLLDDQQDFTDRQVQALTKAGFRPSEEHWYTIEPVPTDAQRQMLGDMLEQTPVRVGPIEAEGQRLKVAFVEAVSDKGIKDISKLGFKATKVDAPLTQNSLT